MRIDRRKFISTTVTVMGGISFYGIIMKKNDFKPLRFGIFTDSHYADKEPLGSRYYRESLYKLSECVGLMNEEKVDFLIELGDFKDQGDPPEEKGTLRFLSAIETEFCRFRGPHYHVLGNHDHDSISKMQFLDGISNSGFGKAEAYYSFNVNSFHFVVLDANYSSSGLQYDHGNFDWTDAHIPAKQLKWLKRDLRTNRMPAVVFIHHRLDVTNQDNKIYGPGNAESVRKILESSGNVLIVFQGHEHKGEISTINDIHYYTLKGMVEGSGSAGNSFAIVEINSDLKIKVTGFCKAVSAEFS